MGRKVFKSGMVFGRLTLIQEEKRGVKNFWKMKCQCGNDQYYRTDYISQMKCLGRKFECEECKYKRRFPCLNDKIYGRLSVIKEVPSKTKKRMWLVRCECGVEKEIQTSSLTSKSKGTKSCGCLSRKLNSKGVNTTLYPPAHQLKTKYTEEIKANLYHSRNAMVASCYNKDNSRFKIHGKIGHTVCDLWRNGAKDFVLWAIKNGYKKGDGIYLNENETQFSPKNCFIQSKAQYAKINNSRPIEFNNEKKSITEWANELGCTISCISQRLKKYKDFSLDQIMNLKWFKEKKQMYGTEHYEDGIVKMYQEGSSFEEICEELGCCSSTIKRYLDKNNISIRKAVCRSSLKIKEKLQLIDLMVKNGKKYTEISKQLNLKYSSMMYHYRNYINI
jgi:predicted transcriptional regulator